VSPPQRWPLHPLPKPLESLSSWVSRLARQYHLPVKDLLRSLHLDVDVPWNVGTLVGAVAAESLPRSDLPNLRR
jgi:TniQ